MGLSDRRRGQHPYGTRRRPVHQKQDWYSGKHKRHGAAVQTVAAPDGELLWVSGVLPGRTVDITAVRGFKIAEKVLAFLGLLADLGYIGLHPQVITGYKRKRGEKQLPEAKKTANGVQASLSADSNVVNPDLPAEMRLGHAHSSTVMATFPRARPVSRWRTASGTSASG
ncbi:transposase family protein [Micromonosporaceae bacterium Da 78-11]